MTETNLPNPAEITRLQERLVSRIHRFRTAVRWQLLMEGVMGLVLVIAVLALASFLLDRWLRLSIPTRVVLALVMVGVIGREIWRRVIEPLRTELSLIGIAAAVDRKHRTDPFGLKLAPRVASVLELPKLLLSPMPPSRAMVERAVVDCDAALKSIRFESFLNDERKVLVTGGIFSLLSLAVLLAMLHPATTSLWLRRWFAASAENWPQSTHLQVVGVVDGKLIVPKGESFVLRVLNSAASVAPANVSMRYREGQADRVSVVMNRFTDGDFRYEFPSLQSDTEVELSGGDDTPPAFHIEPIDRPKLLDLQLSSQHPSEASPTEHHFGGSDADLSFLPKTKLTLTFSTSVPVNLVKLKSNLPSPSLAQLRKVDELHYSLPWVHEAAVQLQIELEGQADLLSLPTPISIGLKQDQPPRISLTFTGVRQRVTPQATIPLVVVARDDYGVAQVDLTIKAERIDSPGTATTEPASSPTGAPANQIVTRPLYGPTTQPGELEMTLKPTLDVSALNLVPGSLLSVSASATDACYLGPQTSRSRLVGFRIVPPEELFKEILLRQQAERVKFRKQIEAAQKIRQALDQLKSNQDAVSVSRDHRLVQRELARTTAALTESITEMKLNLLGGTQAWDLMARKVLTPLNALHDHLMTEQRDGLDNLRVGDAAALATATGRQEQIIATMQELLKQMSQWDSFVDVVNQLNEIIRLESAVKQSTEKLKKKQTEGVFDP